MSWIMARLVNGPAHGRLVRMYVDRYNPEVYRLLIKLVCPPSRITGARYDLGYLMAKYRFSGLSSTEWDGSIPIMLYGFVRIET